MEWAITFQLYNAGHNMQAQIEFYITLIISSW